MNGPRTEKLAYDHAGAALEAHVALPPGEGKLPAVLVCHAWRGQSDFERGKAERLASELGVVGVALDVYGRGVLGGSVLENTKLMMPFRRDRAHLRARLLAGLDAVRAHPRVDAERIAVIGFCFGGLCALDVARAGADVRGVIAFHGLFDPPEGLDVGPVRAKVLALHGHDDPMATPAQVLAFQTEMTQLGADWQVHVYGGTKHAFTNPEANDDARGTVYQPRADRRSWASMRAFLQEVFDQEGFGA